jgi:putative transposase
VDHEGEVLEVFATKRRDRKAALAFLKRAMKRNGSPHAIVTDRLRSYGAAMKEIGVERRQVCGRWLSGANWRPRTPRSGTIGDRLALA